MNTRHSALGLSRNEHWCPLPRQHDLLGPRAIALLGLALSAVGNVIIAIAATNGWKAPYLYAIAYGLIGGGGNGAFIASFQFASLFKSQGTRCALLSSGFNVAGFVFLVLNAPGVSIRGFFWANALFVCLLTVGVVAVFPARSYKFGDVAVVAAPLLDSSSGCA